MAETSPAASVIPRRKGLHIACVALLAVAAGLLAVWFPQDIRRSIKSFLTPLSTPPRVSYASTSEGGQVRVEVAATETKVTVSTDGRVLWLEIAGVEEEPDVDVAVGDGVVRYYDVMPVGPRRSVVLLHLTAYIGHNLAQSEGSVVLDVPRSPLLGRRIALDPGHGGRDPGCVSPSGLREAVLTLAVARELRPLLETAGAAVLLTRDAETDFAFYSHSTMDSLERATAANDWGADVLLSLHFNSYTSQRYRGVEVWHYGDKSESHRLAAAVMGKLSELGLPRRGTKQGNYAVLREAAMPAALVELGFLSNRSDEAFYRQPGSCEQAAALIWQALTEYFR